MLNNGKIEFCIDGSDKCLVLDAKEKIELVEGFELFIGVYNRVIKQFKLKPLSFRLTSFIEAPQGSGLGKLFVNTIAKIAKEFNNECT